MVSVRMIGVAAVCAVGAVACGGGAGDGADGPPVVAVTTSVWADVVAEVVCDAPVEVETIIPTGSDPHAFEPSLADRRVLEEAALVVANGLGLEEGLDDALDAVADGGTPVFRFTDHVETRPYSGAHDDDDGEAHDDDDGEAHDHGEGDDPHVWLDPVRVAAALPALGDAVVAATGVDATTVESCVAQAREDLEALDATIATRLASIPDPHRVLVTNHDALGYFAARYDLEIVGTVIPAPSGLAETNPAQLEALAERIRELGVPAIFAETQHGTDDASALADRVGDVEVVTLYTGSLGEAGSGADTYDGMLRADAERIADALTVG